MTDMKEDLSILALTMAERDRFRAALIEIQKVAEISEGVAWYHMVATRALDDGSQGN